MAQLGGMFDATQVEPQGDYLKGFVLYFSLQAQAA